MITIELGKESDLDEVLELVEALLSELAEEPGDAEVVKKSGLKAQLFRNLSKHHLFLARDGHSQVVGLLTLMTSFAIYAGGEYGVINELFVKPGFRCESVGRMLVDAAKEMGRNQGWARIDVTAPADKKWRRTVQFYERAGFVFSGPKLRYPLS